MSLSCINKPLKLEQNIVTTPHLPDSVLQDTISITAVGDIMLGSAYPSIGNLPKDDAINSFREVKDYLKGDIVFGNLEGCFLNSGKSTKCKDALGNSCFAFRMPERYAGIYKDAGFNLLSVANNHVGDFGLTGRKKTTSILDSLEINYAGQNSKPYALFEKNGIKYAFCAFSPNDNTLQITEIDSAKSLVATLKTKANIVIVSFHGGGEGSKFEHVTRKSEIFYKEDRGNVYAFAHAVIDAGADVVLGHGPHVTRAVECYKGKFIAYSLGNFCTYGMFSLSGPNGIAPLLQLKINAKGDFLSANVISVKQDKINRLTVDKTHAAFRKLQSLTQTDIPENSLVFTPDQQIKPRIN
ncbi:MAG: CapA family protein [Pedobacter sp.]|nr:MAG: CapA family protein [Pedobacter sp.]